MDRGLGNDRLHVHANGFNLPTMDLGRTTRGLEQSDDGSQAGAYV